MIVLPCFQRRGDDNPCDLLTQRCVNTAGSYRCVNLCASGLRHDPRTRECVDIDECQERNVRCQGGKVSQNCSKRQDYREKADDSSLVYNTNVPNQHARYFDTVWYILGRAKFSGCLESLFCVFYLLRERWWDPVWVDWGSALETWPPSKMTPNLPKLGLISFH